MKNGKELWSIETVEDKHWVADFSREEDAQKFAKQYPKMMEDYINKAKQVESEQSVINGKPHKLKDLVTKLDDISDRYKDSNKEDVLVKMDDGKNYRVVGTSMVDGNAVIFTDKKAVAHESEQAGVNESASKNTKLKEILDDLNSFVKEDKDWLTASVVAFTEDGKKYKVDFVGQGDNGEIIVNLGKQVKLKGEAEKVDEATASEDDIEEVTIDDMLKLAKKFYPHNKDGGKTSPIVGIVDGHLADFTAVAFAKHERHPDPGTFFLHDGTKASMDALEEQLEVGMYDESEKVNEASAEADAEAQKLKQYDGKPVDWKEVSTHVDDGNGESHIWLKSPNGVLVCRVDVKTYGRGEEDEPSGFYIVDKQNAKLVEVGHGYTGDSDRFVYAYTPNGVKLDVPDDATTSEDEEAWIKEKELDRAIEEGLKEIYR